MSSRGTDPVCLTMHGVQSGVRSMAAIAVFVVPYGLAFGVAAIEGGIPVGQAVAMSIFMFSGAAQFAALDLWSSHSLLSLLLVVLAVSTRHIVLGASLSPWINQLPRRKRLLSLMVLSDPNFADSFMAFQRTENDIGRLVGGGLILWAAWVIGTLSGALIGAQFGDLDRFGMDVLMPCYFAAMILAQWLDQGPDQRLEQGPHQEARRWRMMQTIFPAIAAMLVTLFGLQILPEGWNIIMAALAGGAVGGFLHDR